MDWAVLYRHPRRRDEAGMTIVADEAGAAATKDRLEHRGYIVIEIVTLTLAKPANKRAYSTGAGLDAGAWL